MVENLNLVEQGRFEVWKIQYLNRPASFEKDLMEVGGFGLRE